MERLITNALQNDFPNKYVRLLVRRYKKTHVPTANKNVSTVPKWPRVQLQVI